MSKQATARNLANEPSISLRGLTIRSVDGPIISAIDLDLDGQGLIGLVGPMGSGKSTLMRFICGQTESDALTSSCRAALCCGCEIGPDNCAGLFAQRPREEAASLSESTALLILRRLLLRSVADATRSDVICADEPTAGLFACHGARLMDALATLARDRLVIVASHNLEQLRGHCDRVVLLGGGKVLADSEGDSFFAAQAGAHAAHFLRTRGLALPREGTDARRLAPEFRNAPPGFVADLLPESGQGWIVPERLWLARSDSDFPPDHAGIRYRIRHDAVERCDSDDHVSCFGLAQEASLIAAADAIVKDLDCGHRAAIENGTDTAAAARFLGAFLLRAGAAPGAASEAICRAIPEISRQSGLEEWLWNLDLAMALAGSGSAMGDISRPLLIK